MATDKKKRGPGKPKRVFTAAQMKYMGDLALAGCQTLTIATLMEIPRETIDQRNDIQQFLTKKRCERKLRLRKQQEKATKSGVPSMLIWMGKQTLGQVDKQETQHTLSKETITLLGMIDGGDKGKLPDSQETEEAGQ
jgi:hypothetical protein